MTTETNEFRPYSLEVVPHPHSAGSWQCTIRHHGKVFQRSDCKHPSEVKARQDGQETIEKLKHGRDDQR